MTTISFKEKVLQSVQEMPQDIGIEDIMVHEDWKPNDFVRGHDIALVRLKKPIVLATVSFF